MSQTPFIPDVAFCEWAMRVAEIVEQQTGVPRFRLFAGRKTRGFKGRETEAKVVFREALRRLSGLSFPRVAYMLGIDHSGIVGAWQKYAETLHRVLSLAPAWDGAIEVRVDYAREHPRCPMCGALVARAIVI